MIKDKVLRTIIIVVSILAIAYILTHISFDIEFKDDDSTKMPDYNDYNRKPEFRVAADSNQFYVEYKAYDMEKWKRNDIGFSKKEDAQAVVNNCEKELNLRYEKIISETQ